MNKAFTSVCKICPFIRTLRACVFIQHLVFGTNDVRLYTKFSRLSSCKFDTD